MSVDHYENFPVASLLCPPGLRPAVSAIYGFARTADDIADEGDAGAAERLADLAAYRDDLRAVRDSGARSRRWPRVFGPLAAVLASHALSAELLADLLSAFEQDVVKHAYADRAELLDYCRRSANPIGRLLLQLYGVTDSVAQRQSDAICTALQLANFWQDLSVDVPRGRLYLPASDCARRGVAPQGLLARLAAPNVGTLLADMIGWARELIRFGAPLVHTIPGRAGWELRLVVQGGLRILEKTEALGSAALQIRPVLNWVDFALILWRALWMRPARSNVASEAA